MATDNLNNLSDTESTLAHEGEVERVNLTQAVTQVQLPQGAEVVRIQVTPGETIQLPFPSDRMVARLDDGNGNLAVKVGEITVILQGYIAATGEQDVRLIDANGAEVDVAAVVAATDPNLDIATAAGPAAGDTGVDNTGGVFSPFDPASGLGGLNSVGGLQATQLDYGLIERQFIVFETEEEAATVDTVPEITSITGAVVNEDDLRGGEGNDSVSSFKALEPYPYHVINDLTAQLGVGGAWWSPSYGNGNDPFDTGDHEDGSQQPGLSDDVNGIDQDREPTTVTGVVSVNFYADLPGRLSFENGGTTPILDQLNALGLTSHSHLLQYVVLPGAPDTDPDPNIDNSYGETLVAYYVETYGEGEQDSFATVVFTIAFREYEGVDPLTDFNVDFTIYGVVDNVPGITDADGDITEALDIGVPFFVIDSNGSVVPVAADELVFKDIDDVPSLGLLNNEWVEIGEGQSAILPVGIDPTDTNIVHDETKGDQNGTDDVDLGSYPGNYLVPQALAAAGLAGATPVGAAFTQLAISFGADGRAGVYDSGSNSYIGNKEAGETVFAGDKGAYAQAYQLYIGAADAPLDGGTTNWTITLDGEVVDVLARQVDANTIVGYALDGQQNEVPVFVLHLDPQLGQLTLVQLHQINHDDPLSENESSPSLLIGGEPVSFRATDYDGDHVDAPLSVTTLDDAPTSIGAGYIFRLDEDFLTKTTNGIDGNQDADGTTGDESGGTKAAGSASVFFDNLQPGFGTDVPGHFGVTVDAANFAGLRTSAGKDILLATAADRVTGYVDTDGNGTLDPSEEVDDNRVFQFEIDAVTGDFSLELFQALKHDNPDGVDSVETDITLSFRLTATDADGDSVGIGLNFQANDDAPTISVVDDHSVTVRLDESTGKDATDPSTAPQEDDTLLPGAIGQAKANIGSFFTNIAFGADGPMGGVNNPDYALVLRNTDGSAAEIGVTQVPTNLYVTDPDNIYVNDNIVLVAISAYQVNGYVHYEGPDSPNNILALTIQVDASWAEVTVTQYLPIAHDVDGASPDDHDDIASLTVDAAGGIFASATVIDGDGDKVTAISDSPVSFVIEDDGPKLIDVVHQGEAGEPGPFLIDEDSLDGGLAGGPGDNAGSASVAYKVNVDFGTDGGAANAFVFVTAVPSVPLMTVDGQAISMGTLASEVMGLPAGTVIGYTGADINDPASWAFTATIDASTGAGSFTLLKPLHHPLTDDPVNKDTEETAFEDNITLTLKVRAIDGDGDWVNADIIIDIDDDSPTAANVTYPDPIVEDSAPVYLWTLAEFLDANVAGGADGYKNGSLTFGPGSLGGTLEVIDDGGVLKIRYTAPDSVAGNKDAPLDETFSYSVQDNDNDLVNASVTVAVADGAAPALTDGKGSVDEEGLPGGVAGTVYGDGSDLAGQSKTTGGTLAVVLGTDPLAADNEFNLTGLNNLNGLMTLDGTLVALSGPATSGDAANTILTYTGFKTGGDATNPADQVFTLTLNRDTGQWSFELKQPVKHPTADTEDNLTVEFGVNVTDIDGSTGTGKISVMIDDDSPVAGLSTQTPYGLIVLDETPGDQFGDSDLTGGVSQRTGFSFAGPPVSQLFASQYGADGAGTTTYALTKGNGDSFGTTAGTGTASGLYATSVPGTEIFLFRNGDAVEGRIGNDPQGTLAFTVSLEGDAVKVEQWLALKHPTGNHQELVLLDDVSVTQTITDADGDSDTATTPIRVDFWDDGPSVTVTKGDDSSVILQTRDAFTDGSPTDQDVSKSTADLSDVFDWSKNGGADGEKSSSLTFELVFLAPTVEGDASGLTIGGNPIYLHQIGGVMVGSTSAIEPANAADPSVVFTIAVESLTGIVTLTQLRQIDHVVPEGAPDYDDDVRSLADGLIGLKATGAITDGDDDSDTDSQTVDLGGNIRFADDGPLAGDKDFGAVVENSAPTTLSTVAGFVAANAQGGADEYQSGSFTLMDGANPVASLVGSLGGTLAIVAGELRYTPPANVDNDNPNTETFTYRVADKDGDTETGLITISITDGAAPALVLAEGSVDEEGLPGGVAGTVYGDGSDLAGQSKTTGGTLAVVLGTDPLAADNEFNLTGLNNLNGLMTLDGTLVALSGPATSGDAANTILTYTGFKTGGDATNPADQVFTLTLNRDTGQWSFELKQPVKHPTADTEDNLTVEFGVSVTDSDGSTGSNKITVVIDDDSPDARNDFDSVENFQTTDGNVITGVGTSDPAAGKDLTGADNATVSAIASMNQPGNMPTPTNDGVHGAGFVIQGEFGTLTIYADGHYSYSRSSGDPLIDADVFTYTLKDGDTDTDSATLTINIYDEGTELAFKDNEVDEQGLPTRIINAVIEPAGTGEVADGNGSDDDDKSEATTGNITFSTPDGFGSLTIEGKLISNGAVLEGLYGTLVVTAFDGPGGTLSYTYTLKDNADHSGGAVSDNFAIVVTDADGDQSSDTLNINIVDDVPDARNDFDSVQNFLTTDGNVITGLGTSDPAAGKDLAGADNATVSAIASVNAPASVPVPTNDGVHGAGFVIAGEFGTLTIYADGHYSYSRTNGDPMVDSDVFTYTLKDGDTDTDPATLTINIYDEGTELTVTDKEVDEQGLPTRTINAVIEPAGTGEAADGNGSDDDDKSEATTGNVTFATPDGFGSLTIEGKDGPVAISNGAVVEGLYGTLVVTAFDGPGGTLSYTYTLKDNADHSGGAVSDNFAVVVTDADGDQSSDTLNINIVDDAPVADDDNAGSVNAGSKIEVKDAASGVLANDLFGADDEKSGGGLIGVKTGQNSGESTANIGGTVESALGFLTLNADGTYSYTAKTNASGTDYFTYTIEDGDGDRDTAVLTISVKDQAEGTIGGSTTVYEDGVADQHTGGTTTATQLLGVTFSPADNEVLKTLTLKNLPTGWKVYDGITELGTGTGADFVIDTVLHPLANLRILPPADNADGDLALGIEGFLEDQNGGLSNTIAGTLTIVRDAVADKPTNVEITVADSNDANSSFGTSETGSLQVKATFGDATDGSEVHTVTVTLHPGFTAGLLAAGVTGSGIPYTYNAVTGVIVFSVPNGTGSLNETFAITSPATALSGSLNFTAVATATETNLDGSEQTLTNNVATTEATTAIPASRLLDGVFKTNTNVSSQQLVITFVDKTNPLMAVAQVYSLNLQGQQGNVLTDAGFDINKDHHYLVGVEAAVNPKVIVTDVTLENAVLQSGGNFQLELNDSAAGADRTAYTFEIQPDVAAPIQTATASTDGDNKNESITDATPSTFHYLYGASGDDTLTGSSGADMLNGGPGKDSVSGMGGNDIIVFDAADTLLDGGTGFDILRIDAGAIANTATLESGGLSGLVTVNLQNNTAIKNIESILITTEANVQNGGDYGTKVVLNAADVLAFTDNVKDADEATAHSLYIVGADGDQVDIDGLFNADGTPQAGNTTWTYAGDVVREGGMIFAQYNANSGGINVTLYVDKDVTVV